MKPCEHGRKTWRQRRVPVAVSCRHQRRAWAGTMPTAPPRCHNEAVTKEAGQ